MNWIITYEINGGEYEGRIIANKKPKRVPFSNDTILVGGVKLVFDEDVLRIEQENPNPGQAKKDEAGK